MQELGYMLFLITNQSGVGRGFFKIENVIEVHDFLQKTMKEFKLRPFDGIGVCPHHPEAGCDCRKPFPKLINNFIGEHDLDLSKCWMVGDKEIDAEAGINAKISSAIVRTPSSKNKEYKYFKTLMDFANSLPDTTN
jgi:D-glycero-D-manno-heptose 1,7-bisphosphate phosphatase